MHSLGNDASGFPLTLILGIVFPEVFMELGLINHIFWSPGNLQELEVSEGSYVLSVYSRSVRYA